MSRGIAFWGLLLLAHGTVSAEKMPVDVLCRSMAKLHQLYQRAQTNLLAVAAQPEPFQTVATEKVTYGQIVPLSVDITGAETLCLTVTGAHGGGHSYWGEPMLADAAGNQTPLTELTPDLYAVGWSELRVDTPERRHPASWIGNVQMAYGFFAHVDSCILFTLNKRYTRFTAKVGLQQSSSRDAWAQYAVQAKPTAKQAEQLKKRGLLSPSRTEGVEKAWKAAAEDGPLAFETWVTAPGTAAVEATLQTLFSQCGAEPELKKRLEELQTSKRNSSELEWILTDRKSLFVWCRHPPDFASLDARFHGGDTTGTCSGRQERGRSAPGRPGHAPDGPERRRLEGLNAGLMQSGRTARGQLLAWIVTGSVS